MMNVLVVHFARFGPYHLARIDAAVRELLPLGWEVVGLETGGADETYAWRKEESRQSWTRHTVFPGEAAESISSGRLRSGMMEALDQFQPAAVAIAGWGTVDARASLDWCRRNGAKAILMSETREADGTRVWWKEWVKSRIIRRFDGALVGGESHRDYLVKLGMSAERIRFGYNVVDNDFFEAGAEKWKVQSSPVRCREYFLASNRFIERKNLSRLIEAYANSLHLDFPVWDLCLLGDGELKAKLIKQCQGLGLEVAECEPWEVSRGEGPRVFFPGFQQIEELPCFYAQAGCFVHPALEEPWGLVINEAMACGLPILSGSNVGAAEELVDDEVNGWVFEATELDAMSQRLRKITGMEITERLKMGQESTRILKDRAATESFGKGLAELVGETS